MLPFGKLGKTRACEAHSVTSRSPTKTRLPGPFWGHPSVLHTSQVAMPRRSGTGAPWANNFGLWFWG
jgi:hypothetical protein